MRLRGQASYPARFKLVELAQDVLMSMFATGYGFLVGHLSLFALNIWICYSFIGNTKDNSGEKSGETHSFVLCTQIFLAIFSFRNGPVQAIRKFRATPVIQASYRSFLHSQLIPIKCKGGIP